MEPTTSRWTIRRAEERGRTQLSWLDSRHTFSFGSYHDPAHMGFRSLRVINDDRVAGRAGFGEHPHRDMEILTWPLEGQLAHRDSTGEESTITPGTLQVMTAGRGITHSEFNPARETSHFLQIWILPDERGLAPSYQQREFAQTDRRDGWCLIASGSDSSAALPIHQDAEVYTTLLDAGQQRTFELRAQRHLWLHVATGRIELEDMVLGAGDAVSTSGPTRMDLTASEPSQLIVFDLA